MDGQPGCPAADRAVAKPGGHRELLAVRGECHRIDEAPRVVAPQFFAGGRVEQQQVVWHLGGPAADTGLSGRKIVVDNYGADCPIGGGSFSGKDPTKVDRSAAYAARYIAKNLVASGIAKRVQVQLAYAIGVVEPLSVRVDTFGTGRVSDEKITDAVRKSMSLSPKGIIDRFDLRRPIYAATASGGHFGRSGFPWEELSLVAELKKLVEGENP